MWNIPQKREAGMQLFSYYVCYKLSYSDIFEILSRKSFIDVAKKTVSHGNENDIYLQYI